jgi:hypothetical protein
MRIPADRLILVAMALAVVAVAGFAAVVSYSHFYDLGRALGQDGTSARLTPLSVDLLILASSLVLLWAARNNVQVPKPIRLVLVTSVGATIAGNVLDGWADGPVGAALNGWPGYAFVAAIEIGMWLVRAAKKAAAEKAARAVPGEGPATGNYAAAMASYRATHAAGNPWSQNQLQQQFSLTRAQAAEVRRSMDAPAAAAPSPGPGAAAGALNGKVTDG